MQTTMTTRAFGKTGMAITPVGFGAWAIGGDAWKFGWGPQDDSESIAAIHRALSLGINWIDTAAAYGFGRSEEVVARALAGMAEPPLLFTKCGLVPSGEADGGTREDLSRASILAECEASLRRLGVEALDLYQIHWPTDELADIDDGWGALVDLKAAGKVRHIGVSNFSIPELERARRLAPVETLQPPYSLVRDEFERGLATYCREWGAGVIVYSPMQSGLLTGAMTAERAASLPTTDWRSRNDEFREPKLARNLALVERLRAVGARYGATPGEIAIAWTLRDPVVSGAIVGARTAAQVDGIVGAARIELDEADLRAIAQDATGPARDIAHTAP